MSEAEPLDEIEKAMENFTEAQTMFSRRNCEKWKQLGHHIDVASRFLIPSCFFSILVFLFNMQVCARRRSRLSAGAVLRKACASGHCAPRHCVLSLSY